MHRFDTYDETIRKHHLFNPEVYIEDPDKRAGVALYLEGLGYDITMASVGIGKHAKLSYDRIELNDILSITKYGQIGIGCISDIFDRDKPGYHDTVVKELNEHCEKYRYIDIDGRQIDLAPISCEDNAALFKVLALYRDDTDYGKLIWYKDPSKEWYENSKKDALTREFDRLWINCQWDNFEKDCDVDWVRERCIMLNTLEDILKYKHFLH